MTFRSALFVAAALSITLPACNAAKVDEPVSSSDELRLDEAQTIGSHLVSLVRLYKALGGGWPQAPEPPPTITTTTQTQ